mmetsp:Transcript_32035/g.64687  ORF Transcript_32035/g.64687 Transcript_32035/m.64687 type:complete len:666 (+) Transcript_32035:2952-4949(+)
MILMLLLVVVLLIITLFSSTTHHAITTSIVVQAATIVIPKSFITIPFGTTITKLSFTSLIRLIPMIRSTPVTIVIEMIHLSTISLLLTESTCIMIIITRGLLKLTTIKPNLSFIALLLIMTMLLLLPPLEMMTFLKVLQRLLKTMRLIRFLTIRRNPSFHPTRRRRRSRGRNCIRKSRIVTSTTIVHIRSRRMALIHLFRWTNLNPMTGHIAETAYVAFWWLMMMCLRVVIPMHTIIEPAAVVTVCRTSLNPMSRNITETANVAFRRNLMWSRRCHCITIVASLHSSTIKGTTATTIIVVGGHLMLLPIPWSPFHIVSMHATIEMTAAVIAVIITHIWMTLIIIHILGSSILITLMIHNILGRTGLNPMPRNIAETTDITLWWNWIMRLLLLLMVMWGCLHVVIAMHTTIETGVVVVVVHLTLMMMISIVFGWTSLNPMSWDITETTNVSFGWYLMWSRRCLHFVIAALHSDIKCTTTIVVIVSTIEVITTTSPIIVNDTGIIFAIDTATAAEIPFITSILIHAATMMSMIIRTVVVLMTLRWWWRILLTSHLRRRSTIRFATTCPLLLLRRLIPIIIVPSCTLIPLLWLLPPLLRLLLSPLLWMIIVSITTTTLPFTIWRWSHSTITTTASIIIRFIHLEWSHATITTTTSNIISAATIRFILE